MSYCQSPLDDYLQNLCQDSYGGGGRHIIFFPNYVPTDPSDGVEIQEMINASEAVLIKEVKIGIPEPSPVTITPYISCQTDITANYDRTFTLMDQNVVSDNIDFYNSLKRRTTIAGVMIYECDAERVTFIDADISVTGGRLLPDDNTDLQHFSLTGSWRAEDDPNVFTAPANIF